MSIKRATHSMNIIENRNGIALVEITRDDATTDTEKRFYVVYINSDQGQVYSAVPADCPDSGRWYGAVSVEGVFYVANPRTYLSARRWFNKLSAV